ncbi:MAG TPA: FlgO family outer membrane protein, partial [Candidatus Udaeobacter sp.]|nr:FlgO family outer membrane protein [Candidatus Udaeobacter sp.]
LRDHPHIRLRMGVHSGPVNRITDVNDKTNFAGSGINVAQRVLDCGDAEHILLSAHVAEDLAQYRDWQPWLHDLGDCDVKHGLRLHLFNLCKENLGNPQVPEKLRRRRKWKQQSDIIHPVSLPRRPRSLLVLTLVVAALAMVISSLTFFQRLSLMTRSTPPEKSIAILPFENLSDQKENTYFADGVQDEILTALAKIADLKVISRTSTMQYKTTAERNVREIANALGVAHVLEGTVQRAGGRVRVRAQLIDARTDTQLWAERYDRDVADVFAIESELAGKIVAQLQAKISPSEKAAIEKRSTTDIAAYDLYLRAQELFADTTDPIHAREKLPQAAKLLDESVGRDPHFIQAWGLLSRVHGAAYFRGHDHTPARLGLANAAAQTALRLQPDAGEAHLALAIYYYNGFRDYGRARSELVIARRALPNNADVFRYTGMIDRREGHWDEATRNLERALELDPRNFFTLQQLALAYGWQRRYADEVRTYDRALAIMPGDPGSRINLALIALDWRADIKPFQATLATLVAENPGLPLDLDALDSALCERPATAAIRALTNYPREGVVNHGVNNPRAYWDGVIARCQGDSAKAQAAFTAARREVEKTVETQSDFAAALSLLGMIDAVLERKEQAIQEGRRGCELLPISKDAIDGADIAINLAQIYAWTGEKDRAIEQIEAVQRVPNSLSYGLLKLHPYWDSLRGDPRFEKIVASLAPKL